MAFQTKSVKRAMFRTEVVKEKRKTRSSPILSFMSLTMLCTAKPSASTDPERRLIFPNLLITQ
jgi:hypothetical protein